MDFVFIGRAVENIILELKFVRDGNKLCCYWHFVDSLVIGFGAWLFLLYSVAGF